ncbi:MAG: transposase [Candidatus Andersenbacteria bacterium]|nr:transposase [Candidatus Andersenbacteria bacterium]
MSYRYDELAPGEVYHICTRGVEQRIIFRHNEDRQRFIKLMIHCLARDETISFSTAQKLKHEVVLSEDGAGLVDLLCYCLMDNHVHMLVRENIGGGTSKYLLRLLTGYAKYFNMSEHRSGSLFVNPFRAVLVDGDEQLLHVSRYIHLNPYVSRVIDDPLGYRWSSLPEYLADRHATKATCHRSLLHSIIGARDYKKFVVNEAGYARSLGDIKHLLVDNDY